MAANDLRDLPPAYKREGDDECSLPTPDANGKHQQYGQNQGWYSGHELCDRGDGPIE